ncbi:MAG: Rpn family recombination-promoting nuclease/putative transposase [Magnetococcales bacterium]|nr:Rpn family recombination-promoting nuclease/putative transposase [Magnetococcales bacterium]
MAKKRLLISFDWAMKRLLRSKANFEILEGFLSELLREEIQIVEVLESESNKEDRHDKHNRVDIKVNNSRGELILIEIQYEREQDYLQRLLYGTAKAVTEHLTEGEPYSSVVKVISVSILYFDLGQGNDYIYRGHTVFKGLHTDEELCLSEGQKTLFQRDSIAQLFPEYYLIKVNRFHDVAKDTLDEWIYFLKNGEIRTEFTARGLSKAKEQLDIMKLPDAERCAYERYQEDLHYQASMVESTYGLGKLEGLKEGIQIGEQKGLKEGRQEGETRVLLRFLRRRFEPLPDWVEPRIAAANLELLELWTDRVLAAQSLQDVFGDEAMIEVDSQSAHDNGVVIVID